MMIPSPPRTPPARKNLQHVEHPDQQIVSYLEDSEYRWLEYEAVIALFRVIDTLPISTAPAISGEGPEGLFFYRKLQNLNLDDIDWEFDSPVLLPGEVPIRYSEGRTEFSCDNEYMKGFLYRRVYESEDDDVLFHLVHYLSHEVEKEDGDRKTETDDSGGDEDDDEDDQPDDDEEEFEVDFEDPVPYVDPVPAAVKSAYFAEALQGPYHGSDVAPVANLETIFGLTALRPFVIVMQKSSSAESREVIVWCISQMVLSRVSNVKSGWKSVFKVFTIAAADERKQIVLLAFETMEKIVREYLSYITETEATIFTDCVRCRLTFTNSKFTNDVSLNAIALLRFCALKLAEGGLVWNEKDRSSSPGTPVTDDPEPNSQNFMDADDNISYWVLLLTGLSKLTSDSGSAIRKSSLEVLFNILNSHGHLFSPIFWISVFSSVIYPIFNSVWGENDLLSKDELCSFSPHFKEVSWDAETSAMAAQSLVDLFVSFFTVIRSQLAGLITSPAQGPSVAGVGALLWLADKLGGSFSEDEWKEIFLAVKEAASLTLSSFMKILRTIDDMETLSNEDNVSLQNMSYVVSRTKSHITVQLQVFQVVTDLHRIHQQSLLASHVRDILEILSSISSHAHQLNSDLLLQKRVRRACSILELSEPPMLHLENDTHQNYLDILQDLLTYNPGVDLELNI